MFFMSRDCDICFTHSKDWIELSTIVYKNFQIARTDCHFERDVCEIFRIHKFPTILYVKDNKVFSYQGDVDLSGLLEYLSDSNYLESYVYRNDF
mmetsp:Transcript_5362/g.4938  ORF Transcript_5362/g.4938 Transcript_5362/m.4938 type:complete len:94 (+) Transcript_5362:148-429(+)